MKIIILSNGKSAQVSDEDYDYLNQFNWCPIGGRGGPYAGRGSDKNREYMHMEVLKRMRIEIPFDMEVDHRDQNSLNNQRENLRVVTKSINRHNTRTQHNNTSGCRGVKFNERAYRWIATINIRGTRIHLGSFIDYEKAVEARKLAERKYLNG